MQREIAKLKNQLHQAHMAKERAECGSKSKKEDSQEDDVGSKRISQQAKSANASRQGPSPPSQPRNGFKMLPTGDFSDSEEEEDYIEQNVRATYAKAKFASIQPIIQQQTVQVEFEPKPTRVGAGQVITGTHQRLIDLAIDSMQDDETIGMPDLESGDEPEHQESINGTPNFEVEDDGIIEYMHNRLSQMRSSELTSKQDRLCHYATKCMDQSNLTIIGVVGCIRQWCLGRI